MFDWLSSAAESLKTTFTDAVCPECPVCPTLSEQLWSAANEYTTMAQDTLAQIPTYAYVAGGAIVAGIVYRFALNTNEEKAQNQAWPISYDEITPVTHEKRTRQTDIRDYFYEKNQPRITDYFQRQSRSTLGG